MKQVSTPAQGSPPSEAAAQTPFTFTLRPDQEAHEPPEARGLSRDQVRLMVSYGSGERIVHTRFPTLPDFLQPGDLLVVNTSGTMNAALHVTGPGQKPLELHLSTHLPAGLWVVELRQLEGNTNLPYYEARSGEELSLPGGGRALLHTPHRLDQRWGDPATIKNIQKNRGDPATIKNIQRKRGDPATINDIQMKRGDPRVRLWVATVETPEPIAEYLEQYGFPIRYKYVRQGWPLSYYQTVFARERGSSEMPSAGRAFTRPLVDRLRAQGVQIQPILLHTGVASLESHEPPYEEYYRVPAETARAVNQAHEDGRRVIAVGTTVVRALESAAGADGTVHCGEGYTGLVITPERGVRSVTGLLTGLHEPRSSHLMMLEAIAGPQHVRHAYEAALAGGYLWHEFGDLHLILP